MTEESKGEIGMGDNVYQAREFVTFKITNQLFGIPVLTVQDILKVQRITRIPLAPPEIAGSLNLRGRIVTAMDMRCRLNLPLREDNDCTSIVVEHQGELYSLMVDSVGEVLELENGQFERNPATLEARFREYSSGIFRLDDGLLVILDVDRLLDFESVKAA